MYDNTERKKIESKTDRREFQANFNRNVPINTSYKLLKLGQFETCPTMENRDVSKTNLTRVVFADLADKFRDHQMDMHSGIIPVFAQIIDDNGYPVIASQYSPQVRSMERITPYSYPDKTAKEIVIPPGTKSIAPHAFQGFTNLRRVVIPESVTEIGDHAFYGCSQLKQISIPHSVTTIGNSTFEFCDTLQEVIIPDSVTSIGNFAFGHCLQLKEISIPAGVTMIGKSAFECCSSLTQIAIPDGITEIPECCFQDCFQLNQIIFPQNLRTISAFAFENCYSLRQLTFPDSLTSIRYCSFQACTNLEQIITGPNLTKIGQEAFIFCTNLKYLYINSPRVVLSEGTFWSCDIYHLKMPAQIAYISPDAFIHTRIQIITIEYDENNQVTYSCQNGDINVGLDPQNPGQKILHYNKEVENLQAGSLYISNYEPQHVEYSDYTDVFLGYGAEQEEQEEQEESIEELEPNEPQNSEQQHNEPQNNEPQQFQFNLNDLLNSHHETSDSTASDGNLSFYNFWSDGYSNGDDYFDGDKV